MPEDRPSPRQVVVVASEAVGDRMPGPAIRAWEIARALAPVARVTLVAPGVDRTPDGFAVESLASAAGSRAIRTADVVVAQGFNIPLRDLLQIRGALVVDCYDPLAIELLEHYRHAAPDRWHRAKVDALQDYLLRRGDFFICASERQRAFWLGALLELGRLEPEEYGRDPSLRSLIDLVPFGLPSEPPQKRAAGVRGKFQKIGANDPVVLWNGGIWNWLDPLTGIRAVAALRADVPNIRLVFMGAKHPNDAVPQASIVDEARALAAELKLVDENVFFFSEWVPYDRRADVLLDADLGLSLHLDTAEATLAYRTRLLDCVWAGLPVVCTRGDELAAMVEQTGIGRVVSPGDVEGVTKALRELLQTKALVQAKARMPEVRARMEWSHALRPLVQFVEQRAGAVPRRHVRAGSALTLAARLVAAVAEQRDWGRLWRVVAKNLAEADPAPERSKSRKSTLPWW
ncbi:MAG: glycosyltransferase [Deltaproteobacteria bacterium]|nr:glycosyltransferase [Deltaproteobacteria bacterium]